MKKWGIDLGEEKQRGRTQGDVYVRPGRNFRYESRKQGEKEGGRLLIIFEHVAPQATSCAVAATSVCAKEDASNQNAAHPLLDRTSPLDTYECSPYPLSKYRYLLR